MIQTVSVEQGVQAIVEGVRQNLDELATLIQSHLHDDVPEYYEFHDPALPPAEVEAISTSLEAILRGLEDRLDVADTVPSSMLRQARLAAQANVNLHALLRKSRVAQAYMWDAFLEAARLALPDDDLRTAALRRISHYHFSWNDHVAELLIAEYEAERRLYFVERSDRKKRALVNAVLAGAPADEQALGYPMTGRHLAMIAWGAHPGVAIKEIASGLGVSCLIVSGTDDSEFGWVRRPTRSASADSDLATVDLPADTYVACGQYANDIAGFRRSHRQAALAYRVAKVDSQPITWYRDVSLEALMLRDVPAAKAFVREELGGLLDGTKKSETLLDTIKTYYALGQNAASTGARLHVNERTVAYRLRSVEGILGSTVSQRRDEIAVALRIAELLDRSGGVDDFG